VSVGREVKKSGAGQQGLGRAAAWLPRQHGLGIKPETDTSVSLTALRPSHASSSSVGSSEVSSSFGSSPLILI
jgi:hypothetical protein